MGRILSSLLPNKDGGTYESTGAALAAAGLDWGVTKRPLFARIPNENDPQHGVMKRADGLYGIVRDDNHRTLGAASSRYEVVTNAQAFAPCDVLAKAGDLSVLSANELDGGKFVALHMRAPKSLYVAGEEIVPYILAFTRHDGGGTTTIANAPERFFCTNQLRAIIAAAKRSLLIRIRHTSSAHLRLAEARTTIAALLTEQETFVRTAEELLAETFTRAEFEALAKQLVPEPDRSDPTTTAREITNWESRFETLMHDAYGAADLNDIRFTKWGAVNAVADYEQHLVRVKGDSRKQDETLFRRAYLDGSLTSDAFQLLTA
jgi:phage/plasmid-like protein (TIGR03299 family)